MSDLSGSACSCSAQKALDASEKQAGQCDEPLGHLSSERAVREREG